MNTERVRTSLPHDAPATLCASPAPPPPPPPPNDLALFFAARPATFVPPQSSVVSVCSSADGPKLAVGTSAGSIGVLDVRTHGFTTTLRSHRVGVTAAAMDPWEGHEKFATVSKDCIVR